MLTPAQEQALQAQMLANGAGGAALPPVATNALPTPTPGEIFPSVTTSMPIAPGTTSSWTAKKEGAEAEEKRHAADTADVASANALKTATLGTTEAPTAPPKIAEVPSAAPTGEGLGGGIQQGSTLPEQKQINALSVAAAQKQFEDRKRAEQDALEEKKKARVQAWTDELAAAKAKYAEIAAEPTQDNSWTARLLRGLAAGLGGYSAAINHTPNYAVEIMNAAVNRAIEEKRDKMRQMESRLEKLGAHPEVVDKWADKQWALTLGKLQADLDRVKTASDVMLARFPQAQLEANKMIAEKQATVADEVAKRSATVGERTVGGGTNLPASVLQTVQPGSTKEQGRLPTSNDVTEYATAKVMKGKADRLEQLTKQGFAPTPDQVDDIVNRERQFVSQAHKEGEGPWSNLQGRVFRGAGVMPSGVFPQGMKEETKEWYRLQTELAHAQAVKFYGGMSWMTNPETYQHAMAPRAPQMGDRSDAILDKAKGVIEQARTVNEELEKVSKSGRAEQTADARAAQAPAQTPVQKRYTEETAKQIAQDQRKAPPSTGEIAKRLTSLPSDADRAKAVQAMQLPKSDPRWSDADKWLKKRGLR